MHAGCPIQVAGVLVVLERFRIVERFKPVD